MSDYISREAAIKTIMEHTGMTPIAKLAAETAICRIPASDVVARDCYDRILAENDTMREQLATIGKKPGDKMDDVRPVVRGRWNRYVHDKELWANYCSACNTYLPPGMDWEPNFCPNCGADMREEGNT